MQHNILYLFRVRRRKNMIALLDIQRHTENKKRRIVPINRRCVVGIFFKIERISISFFRSKLDFEFACKCVNGPLQQKPSIE